jgi:hypothetical protein
MAALEVTVDPGQFAHSRRDQVDTPASIGAFNIGVGHTPAVW